VEGVDASTNVYLPCSPAYDLFYSEVPESMRSVCQALNLLTTTLGYIVAGGVNSIFSFWIPSDLNNGHLDYIFYIMGLLSALSVAAFVVVSQSFQYHVPPPVGADTAVSGFSPALPRAARRLLGTLPHLYLQQCDADLHVLTVLCHSPRKTQGNARGQRMSRRKLESSASS
jgi:hypothetical protein